METVSVIVATYGDKDYWGKLALRALGSVNRQTRKADEVIWYHGKDLQEARNTAVNSATSEWIICLDADDLLDEKYIEQMLSVNGTLRFPRIKKIYGDGATELVTHCKANLSVSNFICIGAMFRRCDFLAVGGFLDEPVFEDYSLWIRISNNGADIEPSESVYIYNVNPAGRNHNANVDLQKWNNEIRRRATR